MAGDASTSDTERHDPIMLVRLKQVAPYLGELSTESYRRLLTSVFLGLVVLAMLCAMITVWIGKADGATVLPAILTATFGLVGTAAGYYFARESQGRGSESAPSITAVGAITSGDGQASVS